MLDPSQPIAILVADYEEMLYFSGGSSADKVVEILRRGGFGFSGGYLVEVRQGHDAKEDETEERRKVSRAEILVGGCYEYVDYVMGIRTSTIFYTIYPDNLVKYISKRVYCNRTTPDRVGQ